MAKRFGNVNLLFPYVTAYSESVFSMLAAKRKIAHESDIALRNRPFWMEIMQPRSTPEDLYWNGTWTDWFYGNNFEEVDNVSDSSLFSSLMNYQTTFSGSRNAYSNL